MRGRPPKPPGRKRQEGNRGHRPIKETAPQTSSQAPAAPDYLDAVAAAEWARVVDLMVAGGRWDEMYAATVASYCETWSLYLAVVRKVQQYGVLVKAPQTAADEAAKRKPKPIPNPLLRERRALFAQLQRATHDLGFSPVTRDRVPHAPVKQTETSRLEQHRAKVLAMTKAGGRA